jgi:ATP-GRASP peptide maturase of grasp-with-spasm system
MILILSNEVDTTTDKVTSWLYYYKIPFLRINNDENIDIIKSVVISNDTNEIVIKHNEKEYKLSEFTIIWNRRGYFRASMTSLQTTNLSIKKAFNNVEVHLKDEVKTLFDYIYYKVDEIPHINNPRMYNANKLIALDMAVKSGIKIPLSYISKDISVLKNSSTKYISKSIQDLLSYWDENINFGQEVIELEDCLHINNFFFSLIQERINKVYEIRSFVFFDKIYSMAIFSQNNEKTKLDFRNYDRNKPNRMVPYNLPKKIENKILKFMKCIKMESGSIDFIFDGKDYIFLEINPVGQLDFLSVLCNYNIEKHIADFLKQKNDEIN